MGYTTTFKGSIRLSRRLTEEEAGQLAAIHDDPDRAGTPRPHGYLQWVPSRNRQSIAWDGEEKFRDYVEWMEWLCRWLAAHGITADGELIWKGEDPEDHGVLKVAHGVVHAEAAPRTDGIDEAAMERFREKHRRMSATRIAQGGPVDMRGAPPEAIDRMLAMVTAIGGPGVRTMTIYRNCSQVLAGVDFKLIRSPVDIYTGNAVFVHDDADAQSRQALQIVGAVLAGRKTLLLKTLLLVIDRQDCPDPAALALALGFAGDGVGVCGFAGIDIPPVAFTAAEPYRSACQTLFNTTVRGGHRTTEGPPLRPPPPFPRAGRSP